MNLNCKCARIKPEYEPAFMSLPKMVEPLFFLEELEPDPRYNTDPIAGDLLREPFPGPHSGNDIRKNTTQIPDTIQCKGCQMLEHLEHQVTILDEVLKRIRINAGNRGFAVEEIEEWIEEVKEISENQSDQTDLENRCKKLDQKLEVLLNVHGWINETLGF